VRGRPRPESRAGPPGGRTASSPAVLPPLPLEDERVSDHASGDFEDLILILILGEIGAATLIGAVPADAPA
jgi:hypothetical protein